MQYGSVDYVSNRTLVRSSRRSRIRPSTRTMTMPCSPFPARSRDPLSFLAPTPAATRATDGLMTVDGRTAGRQTARWTASRQSRHQLTPRGNETRHRVSFPRGSSKEGRSQKHLLNQSIPNFGTVGNSRIASFRAQLGTGHDAALAQSTSVSIAARRLLSRLCVPHSSSVPSARSGHDRRRGGARDPKYRSR